MLTIIKKVKKVQFLEQQISILEWFLKDHWRVMMLKMQFWSQELHFKIYYSRKLF